MSAPVAEETGAPGSPSVLIVNSYRSHSPGDSLVIVHIRIHDLSRIRGIEMGKIQICPGLPVSGEIIADFRIAAVLLESHIIPMAVGTVVRG